MISNGGQILSRSTKQTLVFCLLSLFFLFV